MRAAVLHSISEMRVEEVDTPPEIAAVIGVGGIGLLMLQCLKQLGTQSISAFDVDEHKLGLAMDMGAKFCFNSQYTADSRNNAKRFAPLL